MYRNTRGQFKSKKQAKFEARLPLYMITIAMAITLPFGIALQATVWEYIAPEVQAFAPMTDICELETVTCKGEKLERALDMIDYKHDETEKRITYLYEQAEQAGLDPDPLAKTIYCESGWYVVQSGSYYENGVREDSWGLAQIHLPSHPDVTKAQALDAYFAIDWMIEHWHTVTWYGYDRATDTCDNTTPEYWVN